MKTIKISVSAVAVTVLLLSAASCKKDFYTKVNKNPNAPASVVPSVLLPTAETAIGYYVGGEMSQYTSMFTQQTFGQSRQSQIYYQYVMNTSDFDDLWGNMYSSAMENDYTLMQQATSGGNNEYKGISEVLMAYSLQTMVDCWGSIPYSQSFKGVSNLHPAYDNDQTLYGTITTLLNQAIVDLNNPNSGLLTPSTDDFMYGGNAANWIKFAHAIKARLFIHQTKHNNIAMADSALVEVGESFQSNADNATITYGTAATAAGEWYQFNTQRGDISFAYSKMDTVLNMLNDPRKNILIDSTAELTQGPGFGGFYGGIPNAPVDFITYSEMQFVAAEATLRAGGSVVAAQTFYINGITQNMARLGVTSTNTTAYLAGTQGLLPGTTNAAIAQIAYQEWIALYLNPEAWTLWRRTASPTLIPVAGSNGVARRFIYPQSEVNLNNAPPCTMWSPTLFWDN
ncbi:MAG: SusD/RagB family nutrient-binding outer membrane lipoprotein [Bacteroidia bacterium]